MDLLQSIPKAFEYIGAHPDDFKMALQTHLKLSIFAILIGFGVCFPLGVLASRNRFISLYSLNLFGVLRAIPSVAILFVVYPYLQLGFKPALVALTLLACPPILI